MADDENKREAVGALNHEWTNRHNQTPEERRDDLMRAQVYATLWLADVIDRAKLNQ